RDKRTIVEQRIAEIKAYRWDEEPPQESLPKLEELQTIPPANSGEPEAASTNPDSKAAEHQKRPRSQPNPCLVAALNYVEQRGWAVFPAPPGTKKSHKSAEHSGGVRWGATRDPKQIRKDFRKWPDANIGIPTGADNGIVVFETDTPKGHNVDG